MRCTFLFFFSFYFAFFTMPMTGMFTRMADGNHGNGKKDISP